MKPWHYVLFFLLLILCTAAALPLRAQTVIFVDKDAEGAANGSSWTDAYTTLQDALDEAAFGQGNIELWIAEGTYKPNRRTDSGDARTATFSLLNGVAIYGGFVGGEASRSDRNADPAINGTTISGDIGTVGFAGDDAYHVLTGSGTDASAVLDGFTITKGRANGSDFDERDGAGMYNDDGSPTLANCLFLDNTAQDDGGGLYNWNGSSPTITDCTFQNNTAEFGGGGMDNGFDSNPRLEDVTFLANSAGFAGGGISNVSNRPTLINVVFESNFSGFTGGALDNSFNADAVLVNVRFTGNEADNWGGAMSNDDSDPTITNAVFSGNKATDGGAIHNDKSSPVITNATFSGNVAKGDFGGGDGGAIFNTDNSLPQIRNSILWNSSATGSGDQLFIDDSSQPLVGHSIIEGGLPSGAFDEGNNKTQDPQFETDVDPSNAPTTAGDLRILTDGSPVLDAGSDGQLPVDQFDLDGDGDTSEPLPVDIGGMSRVVDNNADGTPTVDIGAYEAPSTVLPVELVSFEVVRHRHGAILTWRTASETNNAGFHVERSIGEGKTFETVGFVGGAGTTSAPQQYSFSNEQLPFTARRLVYRLRQVDIDGSSELSEEVELDLRRTDKLTLHAPFPNPFREQATIRYELPRDTEAQIDIYDALGRRVKTLLSGRHEAGRGELTFRPQGLSSGTYFLRLQTREASLTQRIAVVQ